MDKISVSVEGFTQDQISELQSMVDSMANKFQKENEKISLFLQESNPDEALEVFLKNSKVSVTKRETWAAAIKWAKANLSNI